MVYVFLADGFEEIEALTVVDILRRAGIQVKTVGVTGDFVCSSHSVDVRCDMNIKDMSLDNDLQAIVLPGGMPGTLNLEKSESVIEAINYAFDNELLVCAICAAPTILGHMGRLKGKNAVCFPGCEGELTGANVLESDVCVDGNIITSRSMGTSIDFALEITSKLAGAKKAQEIKTSILHR